MEPCAFYSDINPAIATFILSDRLYSKSIVVSRNFSRSCDELKQFINFGQMPFPFGQMPFALSPTFYRCSSSTGHDLVVMKIRLFKSVVVIRKATFWIASEGVGED
jgi:hypothetical protein